MILTTVHFSCGGCVAKEDVKAWAHPGGRLTRYDSHNKATSYEELAPEGWITFDPWTACTYCPTCWASIQAGAPEEAAS